MQQPGEITKELFWVKKVSLGGYVLRISSHVQCILETLSSHPWSRERLREGERLPDGEEGKEGKVGRGVFAYQRCWFDRGTALSVPVVEGLALNWLGRPRLRPGIAVARLIPYEYMILQKWIKTRRKSSCALSSPAASLSPLFLHKHCCLKCIV